MQRGPPIVLLLKWQQCDQDVLSEIAIHSQISWCKTLKAVYNVALQIAFSLQCILILCGSGKRYHLQYCSVLILTANWEWLSESHHMAESFEGRICETVVVGVIGHLSCCFIPYLLIRSLVGLGVFSAELFPYSRHCCMKLCRQSWVFSLLHILQVTSLSIHHFQDQQTPCEGLLCTAICYQEVMLASAPSIAEAERLDLARLWIQLEGGREWEVDTVVLGQAL